MKNNNKYFIPMLVLLGLAILLLVLWISTRPVITQIKESENITTQATFTVDPQTKKIVGARLAENQKKLAEVQQETQFVNKNNLLFAIAADQRVLGDYSAAKKSLDQAMLNNPNDPFIMYTYATLLNIMGYRKATMEYMDKSLAIMPDNEDVWLFKIDLMQSYKYSNQEIENTFQQGFKSLTTKTTLNLRYIEFLKTNHQYALAYDVLNDLINQKKLDAATYTQQLEELKTLRDAN